VLLIAYFLLGPLLVLAAAICADAQTPADAAAPSAGGPNLVGIVLALGLAVSFIGVLFAFASPR
jgi:hypothetical protein